VHDTFVVKSVFEDEGIPHKLYVIEDEQAAIDYLGRIGKDKTAPCQDLLPALFHLGINLSKGNDLEVLQHFRSHEECTHTRVIAFSSSVATKEQERLADLRVARFFHKPIDYEEFATLGTIVREVIDHEANPTRS
jgi:CheY-like chemotaxis protein